MESDSFQASLLTISPFHQWAQRGGRKGRKVGVGKEDLDKSF